jgi:hypothetical protein
MWGSLMGDRYDVPIPVMIAMFDGKPADVDGSYEASGLLQAPSSSCSRLDTRHLGAGA